MTAAGWRGIQAGEPAIVPLVTNPHGRWVSAETPSPSSAPTAGFRPVSVDVWRRFRARGDEHRLWSLRRIMPCCLLFVQCVGAKNLARQLQKVFERLIN